jgi:hypothetical protein
MDRCNQETITDAAFENLREIHTLNMTGCTQKTITSSVFDMLEVVQRFFSDSFEFPN